MQDLVSLGKGIIRWINQFVIIPIFDWLSRFIGNYGLIILLLTIIIKIGLLPLTYRSYLSQARMKVLKPQVDELSQKYPQRQGSGKTAGYHGSIQKSRCQSHGRMPAHVAAVPDPFCHVQVLPHFH